MYIRSVFRPYTGYPATHPCCFRQLVNTRPPTSTRSQAVARIADRTALQHLCGSRDHLIPHNAISYWWSFGTKPLSLTVSEIFNVICNAMVDMTFIRPLNNGQGYSFWYQSISHIRLPIGCNSNFCSTTHRLATIHTSQTTDRRNTVA